MKKGITITQRFELENITSIDEVSEAIFSYSDTKEEKTNDEDFLLIKKMSKNEVSFADGKFIIPLSQADTNELTKVYYIEAQLIFNSGATNKWNISTRSLSDTLRTEDVSGESDGTETEDITMSTDEIFHYTDTYTKDQIDEKDAETLSEAKGYTDEVAEELDDRLGDVEEALPTKEPAFTVEGHLSKSNAVLATEANKWYPAVYVNDQVSFVKDSYPNIQQWDVIFGTNEFWVVRYTGRSILEVSHHKEIKFITGEPPARVPAYQQQYDVDGIYFSTNGNIYRCLTKTTIPEYTGYIYTWQTYIDAYTKEEIDDILLDFGNGISCSIDPLTYVCTFQLKNGDSVVSSASIDLPLETMVLDVDYDSQTKELVITLKNGTVRRVDISAIVSGLVTVSDFEDAISDIEDALDEKEDKIGPNNKVSADNISKGQSAQTVPITSSSDNGKFLRVDSSGNLVWESVSNAEDNSY